MKRNDRDELMNLAFGDLEPQDADRVSRRTETDPAAARELRLCSELRDGLLELREVPEDQMSVERLRDAALSRGLRARPDRTWLWIPVAAASFAMAMVATKGYVRPQTTTALTPPNVLHEVPKFAAAIGNAAFSVIDPSIGRGTRASSSTVKRDSDRGRALKTASGTARISIRSNAAESKANEPIAENLATGNTPGNTVAGPTDSVTTESGAKSQPIVLIDAGKDKNGAPSVNNATEVGSGANVIVSG